MTEIAGFTPDLAREIVSAVRALRASGLLSSVGTGSDGLFSPKARVYVSNDSGEEIPPYACMQATGTTEIGNQNYIVVDKPADVIGAAGGYLFNEHEAIPIGEEGIAQSGRVVRAISDGTALTAGASWQPVASSWEITTGGDILIAIGSDNIGTDIVRVLFNGSGSSKFYRFTLNEPWTSGVADADILEMDGTDTAIDDDVNDPLGIFDDMTTGDEGICFKQGGIYYAIQADCGSA